jgi:hypothetical protein
MDRISQILRKVLKEEEGRSNRYMFFSNLQQMRRQCDLLLDLDESMVEEILENGHDWAQDHIAEAKNNMDQVFDFLMNQTNDAKKKNMSFVNQDMIMMEGKKKKNVATNKKLWQQSLSWARARYDVCPSAYCNGAAVKRYNSKGGRWTKKY